MEIRSNADGKSIEVFQISYLHCFESVQHGEVIEGFNDLCELLYVKNGSVNVNSKEYSGALRKGQMILQLSGNEGHSFECISETESNVVIIGMNCNKSKIKELAKAPIYLTSRQKRIFAEMLEEGLNAYSPPYNIPSLKKMKLRDEFLFGANQMFELKLEMLLIEIVRNFGSAASCKFSDGYTAESKTADIRSYVDKHYTEKISLDELCFLFGSNKTTLCQNFKKLCGMTIVEYINNKRIEQAKSLLSEKRLSVTQVSEQLGFSSIHYFCRVFKNVTGQPARKCSENIKNTDAGG